MVDMDVNSFWHRQVDSAIQANDGKPLQADDFFESSNRGMDTNADGKITLDEMKQTH